MVGVAVGNEPWASSPAVRRVMRDIRPEIALRLVLHVRGFRYRVAATLDLLRDGA
jgi:G:T-mismatch repair DNA endonuclease (very short patch repair protein)